MRDSGTGKRDVHEGSYVPDVYEGGPEVFEVLIAVWSAELPADGRRYRAAMPLVRGITAGFLPGAGIVQ